MKKGDIDYEKLYKDSIERAKGLKGKWIDEDGEEVAFMIFPELKGSDKIKAEIIDFIKTYVKAHGCTLMNQWIDWIEKQGEKSISKVVTDSHFKRAEAEKTDFVSGQYVQCRKSFDGFKENESYWFEYIGDDVYIGRSDNILNKKFHITPRQLFTLFSQQHDYKQDDKQDEQPAIQSPMSYGKEIDEAMYEACRRYDLPYTDANKYSLADVFHAGVRASENRKSEWSDGDLTCLGYLADFVDKNGDDFYGSNKPNVVKWIRSFADFTTPKQKEWNSDKKDLTKIEQKSVNTVEQRFKINDKVRHKETGKFWTIHWYLADTNSYYVIDEEKLIHHYTEDVLESAEQNPAWNEEEERLAKKDAFNEALDKIEYNSGEPTFDDGWDAAMKYVKTRVITTNSNTNLLK